MFTAIGLLGGSFDPVHVGHLQLARDAMRQLPLSVVRWLPAAQPWQKSQLTDAGHRAKMVRLAIEGDPHFVLDLHEIERGGPTYTIDTLRTVRRAVGDIPLVWIIGGDQLERLDTWRDWRDLVTFAHLAVARRADQPLQAPAAVSEWRAKHQVEPAELAQQPAGGVAEFSMSPVDVSSTEVRHLLRHPDRQAVEQRLSAAVPAAVLDYIRANRLYQ